MKIKYNIIIIIFLLFIFICTFSISKDVNIEKLDTFENSTNENNITVVSGYWKVHNKHGHSKYDEWFKNSLQINQRYIFFCDEETIPYIESFRKNLETIYNPYPLINFYSSKYIKDDYIHPTHIPSIEVATIWNEKIHLLKLAKDGDTNPTEFYIWIDAAVSCYRDKLPPSNKLNLKDVYSLPKDKLCYSYVPEDYHNFSAGVLIIHRDFIDTFHDKYYKELENCNDGWKCGSEQVIFTKLTNSNPELFYKMSEGYGENLVTLYEKYV
jgi:hypothetical protein